MGSGLFGVYLLLLKMCYPKSQSDSQQFSHNLLAYLFLTFSLAIQTLNNVVSY